MQSADISESVHSIFSGLQCACTKAPPHLRMIYDDDDDDEYLQDVNAEDIKTTSNCFLV